MLLSLERAVCSAVFAFSMPASSAVRMVQNANVVGSFFRVPAASHVVSVHPSNSPNGLHNSHTNGAAGGARFKIAVDPPTKAQLGLGEIKGTDPWDPMFPTGPKNRPRRS